MHFKSCWSRTLSFILSQSVASVRQFTEPCGCFERSSSTHETRHGFRCCKRLRTEHSIWLIEEEKHVNNIFCELSTMDTLQASAGWSGTGLERDVAERAHVRGGPGADVRADHVVPGQAAREAAHAGQARGGRRAQKGRGRGRAPFNTVQTDCSRIQIEDVIECDPCLSDEDAVCIYAHADSVQSGVLQRALVSRRRQSRSGKRQ